jgi:hypothetical protein
MVMRTHGYCNNTQCLHDALTLDPSTVKVSASYAAHQCAAIADVKCEKAAIPSVMAEIDYLMVQERNDLYQVLHVNDDLFSGKLGCYPNKALSLKLKPNAKHLHSKPYAVPNIHCLTSKRNLINLLRLVFLNPYGQLGLSSSQRKTVQLVSSVSDSVNPAVGPVNINKTSWACITGSYIT